MKKKKDLLIPEPIEKNLQKQFSAIISTLTTQQRIKKITPKIKEIKTKLERKRKSKDYIQRLWEQ
jgi:membrane protein insertase Oxa1/YidC/SpoIIIJ